LIGAKKRAAAAAHSKSFDKDILMSDWFQSPLQQLIRSSTGWWSVVGDWLQDQFPQHVASLAAKSTRA
jgi:hypothetical protein